MKLMSFFNRKIQDREVRRSMDPELRKLDFTLNLLSKKNIKENEYRNWTIIQRVYFSDQLESIGSNAFKNCYSLKTLQLPSSVKTIGDEAFSMCIELEEVHIPNSKIDFGVDVFGNCRSIRRITLGGLDAVESCASTMFLNSHLRFAYIANSGMVTLSKYKDDVLEKSCRVLNIKTPIDFKLIKDVLEGKEVELEEDKQETIEATSEEEKAI